MLQKMIEPFEDAYKETVSHEFFKIRAYYAALGTLVFSLVSNGFAYSNFMPQADSVNHAFLTANRWEVRLGRFLQPLYAKIRGQITMPWLIGILSILFLIVTVFLLCDMLDIENKAQIFLIAGFLSANVTITQMCAVFIYIDDICMAALMFSTMGVWVVQKIRGWNGIVCAAVCFGMSMGLYQAYMVVAVILFMLLIAKEFMTKRQSMKACILRWGSYITPLVIGIGIYYVLWQFMLKIYNVEPTTGVNSVAQLKNMTIEILISQVKLAYVNFINFFVGNNVVLGTVAKYSTILLITLAAVSVWQYIKIKKLPVYNYLIVLVIVLFYPPVALITSIAMQKTNIDYLTSYGISLFYPILLIVIYGTCKGENRKAVFNRGLAIILSSAVLFANISFSNSAYTTSKVMYDRTLSVVTRVLEDIDVTEGYVLNETEVVIIDVWSPDNILPNTDRYESMRAFKTLSTPYDQAFKTFAALLGYDLNYSSDLTGVDWEKVDDMPCYPYEGYCKMVDGKVVVKFGE